MAKITLSIPDKMKDWIDTNRNINYSDLFQKAVHDVQTNTPEQKNPLFLIACTGGIIMGIVLILMSTLKFMSWEIRLFLPLLGGALTFLSAFTYYKEYGRRRRIVKDDESIST